MRPENKTPERHPAAHLRLVLWRANKAIERVETARLQSMGMGLSDFAILEVLLHKGDLPVNAIGGKVLLTSGSITTAIQRLEEKGWVRREKSEGDRRVVNVQLTDAGREIIEALYSRHVEGLEEMASVLSRAEQAQLIDLLKKLGRHSGSAGDGGVQSGAISASGTGKA
jgi:MarR family 2-MHQ and catechol resistance regulon transcriptional repressor